MVVLKLRDVAGVFWTLRLWAMEPSGQRCFAWLASQNSLPLLDAVMLLESETDAHL